MFLGFVVEFDDVGSITDHHDVWLAFAFEPQAGLMSSEAEQGHADAVVGLDVCLVTVDVDNDVFSFLVTGVFALRVERYALICGVGFDQEASSHRDAVAGLILPFLAVGEVVVAIRHVVGFVEYDVVCGGVAEEIIAFDASV